MPANINEYIGRKSAWHGLGKVTGQYQSWRDILAAGMLDWTVSKRQLSYAGPRINGHPTIDEVPVWATFRDDTDEFLGVVGENYTVIQHSEGFAVVDDLVGAVNGAHYETAGSLGNGEKVWGLADLGISARVGDDESKGYLAFCTSHDGSMRLMFFLTLIRIVCQNTMNQALEQAKHKLVLKHTKNAAQKLEDIHEAIRALETDTRSIEEKLQFLASRKVTKDAMDTVLGKLYPIHKAVHDGQPTVSLDEVIESSTRRDNVLASILELYESNDNNAFPGQRGTYYSLLNTITNHTDHMRGARGGNRAESALFGSGNDLKKKAFDVLLSMANGAPVIETRTIVYPTVSAPVVPEIGGLLGQILDQTVN